MPSERIARVDGHDSAFDQTCICAAQLVDGHAEIPADVVQNGLWRTDGEEIRVDAEPPPFAADPSLHFGLIHPNACLPLRKEPAGRRGRLIGRGSVNDDYRAGMIADLQPAGGQCISAAQGDGIAIGGSAGRVGPAAVVQGDHAADPGRLRRLAGRRLRGQELPCQIASAAVRRLPCPGSEQAGARAVARQACKNTPRCQRAKRRGEG